MHDFLESKWRKVWSYLRIRKVDFNSMPEIKLIRHNNDSFDVHNKIDDSSYIWSCRLYNIFLKN